MYNTFEAMTEQNDCKSDDRSVWCKTWNRIFGTDYNSNQFVLMSALSFGSICFGIAYSMQAPFFPSKAKSQGISEDWIGVISGILDIGFTTGAVLSGKLYTKFQAKNILTTTLAFGGLNLVLFGSLQWINNIVLFKTIAVVLRIGIGLGMGTFFTACFTIIFLEFSESVAKVYAMIEMCYAIGLIIGPVVGGVLYQLGGLITFDFSLPFLILGSIQLLVALIIHNLVNIQKRYEKTEKGSFRQLLKHFGIALNVVIYLNAGALLGFNTATLDLHITYLSPDLSSSIKGLIFFISGIMYALLNHIWGNLAEKLTNCYKISLVGCVSSLICMALVGPLPITGLQPNIWYVVVSQVFLGIGVSAILVGSFVQGFNEISKYGLGESAATTAILSSLFTTSESLGYGISPIVGGYVMQDYGYRWATVPLFFIQLFLTLTIMYFALLRKTK